MSARVTTGIAGLDAVLEGGFVPGRTVLVRGGVGTGKSTLGAQFVMAGVGRGEPGVLLAVDEKPRRLAEDAARFGWDLAAAMADKKLIILDAASYFTVNRSGHRIDARQVVSDLTQQVRTIGAKRLTIDTLSSLVPALEDDFIGRDFLRSLFFALEDNLGCTVLLTSAMDDDRRRVASRPTRTTWPPASSSSAGTARRTARGGA
jgi:circadian clock protein KaiC